jgi:hypothetical protein
MSFNAPSTAEHKKPAGLDAKVFNAFYSGHVKENGVKTIRISRLAYFNDLDVEY